MSNEVKVKQVSCELDGMEVTLHRSETDNVIIVDIKCTGDLDLDEDGVKPRARIYLNEDTLYENPEFDLDEFEAKYGNVDGEDDDE